MSLRPEIFGIRSPIGARELAIESRSTGQAVNLLMRSLRKAIMARILSTRSAESAK
jgi:hypothetical protein